MKKSLLILYAICIVPASAQNKPNFDIIDPAVVLIEIYDSFGERRAYGSGFFIDDKGTIVTNYHVVSDAYKMKVIVKEKGRQYTYEVNNILKGDKNKDLAIISIRNTENKRFKYLKPSSIKTKKGDDCWAIGSPADPYFMNNVSRGIVSNLKSSESPKIIIMTAEIAHGSSGGALINSRGEVIGITSGGWDFKDAVRASLNYAIDISEIRSLPEINKRQVIDPQSTPCKISFYTDSKFGNEAALYIDGNYVGQFDKYFPSNTPSCGAEGTISRSLSSGRHSYYVFYKRLNRYSAVYYVDLKPGQCYQRKVYMPKPVAKKPPKPRPIEKFNSAIYASAAFSTPYSSNEYDGRVYSFGFEKGLSRDISLRFKYQMPKDYVSEYEGNSSNRDYSCSYDYQAFFLDFKVFDNSWGDGNDIEKPGGPWWSPSISFVKLNKERVAGYNAPIQFAEQTSFGFGLSVGYDYHFTERLVGSTELLCMNYRNKKILDEARFNEWSISEEATSIGIKLSMSYRFNTLGKRMNKSLINADWIDFWL